MELSLDCELLEGRESSHPPACGQCPAQCLTHRGWATCHQMCEQGYWKEEMEAEWKEGREGRRRKEDVMETSEFEHPEARPKGVEMEPRCCLASRYSQNLRDPNLWIKGKARWALGAWHMSTQ